MDWLWEWLKQPSSLRVLNFLIGGLGIYIAPEYWQQIVAAIAVFYGLIDGFYNQQKRK